MRSASLRAAPTSKRESSGPSTRPGKSCFEGACQRTPWALCERTGACRSPGAECATISFSQLLYSFNGTSFSSFSLVQQSVTCSNEEEEHNIAPESPINIPSLALAARYSHLPAPGYAINNFSYGLPATPTP